MNRRADGASSRTRASGRVPDGRASRRIGRLAGDHAAPPVPPCPVGRPHARPNARVSTERARSPEHSRSPRTLALALTLSPRTLARARARPNARRKVGLFAEWIPMVQVGRAQLGFPTLVQ